jgi:DNA-binding NarL/FixJ family response regulator
MEVLIVEDNPEMRSLISHALTGLEQIDQVCTANSKSEGLCLLETRQPQLLICDLGLPDGTGIEVVLKAARLQIPSLVISVLCDERTVLEAVKSGASGYLLKDIDAQGIQSAVEQLLDGGAPITPSIAGHILKTVRDNPEQTEQSEQSRINLSKREHEILLLAARGFKVAEVAEQLNLSEHTVSNHTRAVYRKLQVNSKSQAVYKAYQCGLISN